MRALELTGSWPVDHVAAAVVTASGVTSIGDTGSLFRLASLAKPITTWAILVGVEEGLLALDEAIGQPGCTLRHLLAHAGGYAMDGATPIAKPGRRRIYSNTGIELAAAGLEQAAGIPFATYLQEAVLDPLGMASAELRGSPAHAMWSSTDDICRFLAELMTPRLISAATAAQATTVHFAELAGVVPGLGSFDPCPWGLGVEIRGQKSPHWTGTRNSPATYGHFGGAGTLMWVDPVAGGALVALTDRPFDEWGHEAVRRWRELSDAVLEGITGR